MTPRDPTPPDPTPAEVAAELTRRYVAGEMTVEQFEAAVASAIGGEPEPEPDNNPPTPLYVWDGAAWVLPAEHEIAMLDELLDAGTLSRRDHGKHLRRAEKRRDEQQRAVEHETVG